MKANQNLGKEFHQLANQALQVFGEINRLKLSLGIYLVALEKMFEHEAVQEGYGSFNQFLAEIGKSKKQVDTMMRVAEYITEHDVVPTEIPIDKLFLVAKANVPWSEELYHELITLSYTAIKEKYL